MNKCL